MLLLHTQDEAKELLGRPDDWSPEHTIEYLLQHCSYAVVTLGAKGCAAGCRADSIVRAGSAASGLLARTVSLTESTLSADGTLLDGALVLRQAAVAGVEVVDTTGAGDAFSSGFLYGEQQLGAKGCCVLSFQCAATDCWGMLGQSSTQW